MATRIRWIDASDARVTIDGVLEPAGVETLVSLARHLRRTARVTLDFHEAQRISDLALVRLAAELTTDRDSTARCLLVGLSEHQHRLLQYTVPPPPARR